MKCRMCKSQNLFKFLDLGFTPLANGFRNKEQLNEPETYYPLQVFMCESCGLAQLSYVVSPEELYRQDYPYETSTTRSAIEHWNKFAEYVIEKFNLSEKDLVVDIGSNVGVLLESFKTRGIDIQGVDPAPNIVEIANNRGVETICAFFNNDVAKEIVKKKGYASIITATNVFAHIDNLDIFVKDVKALLKEDGVFIFEVPYFVDLIQNLEYDTIYHEHLSYISVKPLISFFEKFNMKVIDIQKLSIHGGSIRVFVSNDPGVETDKSVEEFILTEHKLEIHSRKVLEEFASAVNKHKREIIWLLQSFKHDGKRIAGVSAPAKGMTLLNYCKIDGDILDFITEASTLKIGKFTPGAHIPVVSDEELLNTQPDYALLLGWNFAKDIIEKLSEYSARGGKFIIPIPFPKIIE